MRKTIGLLPFLLTGFAATQTPFPRVDLHAHTDHETDRAKNLRPADVATVSKRLGVQIGVLGEGGCSGEIRDQQTLGAFLQEFAGVPVWRGMQVYGFDWRKCLPANLLDQLDYIAADALIFPYRGGRGIMLWRPNVTFDDPQDFMEQYVAFNERVIGQQIQIWANPTYIPESLKSQYDKLWTPARMDRLISAAVKNNVAIEINVKFQIPGPAFIRRAKRAGAKFAFGSNQHAGGIGEIDYCLRVARECGLTAADIFVPRRKLGL